MAVTIQQIKDTWIPKNTTVPKNNRYEASKALVIPNDAVNLYEAIDLVGGGGSTIDLSIENRNASTLDVTPSGGGVAASVPSATTLLAGLMIASDKVKLNGLSNYTHPNHSGDVTSVGDGAVTIANQAVNNAKLANMASPRFKGRITSGTGSPEDLTGTQATTMLDVFTSGLKGLAPASGGGTTNFLRADGTWTPATGVGTGFSENGISGTGDTADKYRLGGNLNQNTIINGQYTNYLIVNDASLVTLEADSNVPNTSAKTTLSLTSSLLAGALLKSEVNGVTTKYAELRLDPDGTLTGFDQVDGSEKAGVLMASDNQVKIRYTDGVIERNFITNNNGHYAQGLTAGTTTKAVYVDDATGQLFKGDATTGGGGGVVRYDAGDDCYVTASDTGVTFVKGAGTGTFTIPVGVYLISARISGTTADLSANAFSITYTSDVADDFPAVTKINTITAAGASPSVPYVYDIDNTPQIQCTSSSTTMTVRVINLNAFSNWALKLNF